MTEATPARAGGLAPRLVTAAVAVPILLWVLLAGPEWAWLIIVVAAAGVGTHELQAMAGDPDDAPLRALGAVLGSLLVAVIYYAPNGMTAMAGLMVAVQAILVAGLFTYGKLEQAAKSLSAGLAALLWVALFLSFFALLRRDPGEQGRYWVLLVLATIWGGDTGAYFTGRFLGRHRLAATVSPKKTWEGAVGGVLASVGAGFLVVALTPLHFPPVLVLMLTVPAALLGQLGDLCESLFKRACGVKDSGTIIYGHGGILDRVDALLFAGPYFYFFFFFAFPGQNPVGG